MSQLATTAHNHDARFTELTVLARRQDAVCIEGGAKFHNADDGVSLKSAGSQAEAAAQGVFPGGLYRNSCNMVMIRTDTPPTGNLECDVVGNLFGTVVGTVPYPPGFICGLGLSYVSATQVQVADGSARDSTNMWNLDVAGGPLTADITVVGATGGLDTGAEAPATWYAVHVIGDSTGVNPVAALLSVSETAPTLPAGYDIFRRVGWVRNGFGGNFLNFRQVCDGKCRTYWYDEHRLFSGLLALINGSATNWTTVSLAHLVPPTSQTAHYQLEFNGVVIGNDVGIRPTGSTVTSRVFAPINIQQFFPNPPTIFNEFRWQSTGFVGDNSSIDYQMENGAGQLDIYVYGYVDSL